MLVIPIQPRPSQIIRTVLSGQNVQVIINYKDGNTFVDTNANGVDVSLSVLAHENWPLVPVKYNGFLGQLYMLDTQGNDEPEYTQFGDRFILVYLSEEELANGVL